MINVDYRYNLAIYRYCVLKSPFNCLVYQDRRLFIFCDKNTFKHFIFKLTYRNIPSIHPPPNVTKNRKLIIGGAYTGLKVYTMCMEVERVNSYYFFKTHFRCMITCFIKNHV